MTGVPVLFARRNSVYRSLGCDVYDEDRDALTWRGGRAGIFHPPCRAWGKLAQFSKPAPHEMDLAHWSIEMARRFGGVVEHPSTSRLWRASGCSSWGFRDQWDGILIPVLQGAYGHRADKLTCLYLVGIQPPSLLFRSTPSTTVERMCKAEREATPEPFARLLVDLALSCDHSEVFA